jgi:hypothetical protein
MIRLCLLVLISGSWLTGFSQQVSIAAHNTDYNTNFNGWNNTLPNGFTRNATNMYNGTTVSTTGGVFAIPNAGFGYRGSSNSTATTTYLQANYVNNTGSAITQLTISYQAFTIASDARVPTWSVTSSLGNVIPLNWQYNPAETVSSPATRTLTLTGLNVAPGATFFFKFSADRGTGTGASPLIGLNNIKVRSTATVCDVPTNLAENNVVYNGSDFDWDADGSNNFQYVLDQSSSNPTGAGTAINGTTYSTTSLSPSTTYYFHLRQDCGSGSFSNWVMVNFTTPPAPCAAPTGLASANVTHQSADLTWNAQTGVTGYEYVVNTTSADPSAAGTATTSTTYAATGLSELTTYYLHVRTDCGSGNFSPWTTVSFTTPVTPCAAPTGLASANVTHESADLTWNAQTGVTGYEHVVNTTSADPSAAGTATASTSYGATGLSELTTYYLHVRTDCGSGNLSPWTTFSFTTPVTPCDAPTGLASADVTHESADLSWNAQTGVTGYEYVVNTTMADPSAAGTATTSTSYGATGLSELTTYYLHVRTDCGNGNLSPWTTLSFATPVTPCDTASGLAAANVTHESADLSWDAQTGAAGYEYVVNTTMADPSAAGMATTSTTYGATGLSELTTYYLHVRTNCGNGNLSPWATISFTTPVTPCDAPTNLMSDDLTHESATLSWDVQSGVTGYQYVLNELMADPAASGMFTTDTFFMANGLSELTTYYMHVRTDCGNGNLSPWVTLTFATPVTPCDAPAGLASANVTHESADLSWNEQTGVAGYEYVVNTSSADPAAAGTQTADTSYDASGLSELTTYYLHVRTDCGNGNLSPWVTYSFTTPVTPCDAPTGLSAANITFSSADLSWTAQTGVAGYEYVVNQVSADPTVAGTSTTSVTYAATGLNEQATYYLHVRTDCGNGNFSPWVTIPFTTVAEPCDAPTGLSAANISYTGADLSWTSQSGISGYEYLVNNTSADPAGSGVSNNTNAVAAGGLTSGTVYYLHVRTQCANGEYSPWTTISFTTLVNNLGIEEAKEALVQVYPNPVSGMLTIETVNGDGYAHLVNAEGKELSAFVVDGSAQFDMSAFPAGAYFVRFIQNGSATTIKVMKL